MITSSLQPFCCCNPTSASCDETGKVRITWQVQLADAYVKHLSCVTYCAPVCNPTCPPAPTSAPGSGGNASIGATGYTATLIPTVEPCLASGYEITANNSWVMQPVSLDFTFKSSVLNDTGSTWIYSGNNGLTTTTTVLTYSARRRVDTYSDYVTTCWSSAGVGNSQTFVSSNIGQTTPNSNCGCTLIEVRYFNRAYYLTSPMPFTIKAANSTAKYYSVELVGAVRYFRLWNASNVNFYSLDISSLTLEQVRVTLDAQVSIVCASLMPGVSGAALATQQLPANLFEARAFVPIPTTIQTAVGVYLFAPGQTTQWWQLEAVSPLWSLTNGGAALRYDQQPNLAFSQGYDDAAEAMFCMGYETKVNINTEGGTNNWWIYTRSQFDGYIDGGDGSLGYGVYAPAPIYNNLWTCTNGTFTNGSSVALTRCVFGAWGNQPVPLGSGESTPVTSGMMGATSFVGISSTSTCDFETGCEDVCCPNENPTYDKISSACCLDYNGTSWITQGMFRLERIV